MARAEKSQENPKNSRVVSLAQLALLLDRDRNTISKWISLGAPIIQRGEKSQGTSWEIDLADFVRWMEERAASQAASAVIVDPNGMAKEEADRRRAVALAHLTELELEEARNQVVRVDDVSSLVAQEYAAVRAALQAIPPKLAVRVAGQTDPNIIQAEVESSIRHALEGLKHDRPSA